MSAEQFNVTKQTLDTERLPLARGRYETVSQVQETKQVSYSVRHDEDRIEREGDVTIEGMMRLAQRQ
jgi:hypothetical protein